MDNIVINQLAKQWSLIGPDRYFDWRQNKLDSMSQAANQGFIPVKSLKNPTESEKKQLISACNIGNMALYETQETDKDPDEIRRDLRSFVDNFGLIIAEKHRSAGNSGIVSLKVTSEGTKRGYIPYSRKPINWHTDGYYNAATQQIRAMILHCVHPADDGGQSQLLDPEITYIRLRDENPDYIKALMHPEAMTIPENIEGDGTVRPASVGPVFWVDENDQLIMRYTARTRSISWRDDPTTREAVSFLQNLLENGDIFTKTATLKAGQGVLCNNVLHNRTGFDPDLTKKCNRMLFRVRFFNRISQEATQWQN